MSILLVLHASIAGFMIFFMLIVPPSAFKALSTDSVSKFLRVLFPRMFIFGLILSTIATIVGAATSKDLRTTLSGIVALGFVLNLVILTPRINKYRDMDLEGDKVAKRTFAYLHTASVIIFVLQTVISVLIIIDHFVSLI